MRERATPPPLPRSIAHDVTHTHTTRKPGGNGIVKGITWRPLMMSSKHFGLQDPSQAKPSDLAAASPTSTAAYTTIRPFDFSTAACILRPLPASFDLGVTSPQLAQMTSPPPSVSLDLHRRLLQNPSFGSPIKDLNCTSCSFALGIASTKKGPTALRPAARLHLAFAGRALRLVPAGTRVQMLRAATQRWPRLGPESRPARRCVMAGPQFADGGHGCGWSQVSAK